MFSNSFLERGTVLPFLNTAALPLLTNIKEIQAMNHQQIIEFCQRGQDVANLFETSPFVTIAAVNGYALGG